MNKKTLLTLVAALMIACPAFASNDNDHLMPFEAVDANHDNFISQEEAIAVEGLTEIFAKVDANQDGMMDATEYEQAVK